VKVRELMAALAELDPEGDVYLADGDFSREQHGGELVEVEDSHWSLERNQPVHPDFMFTDEDVVPAVVLWGSEKPQAVKP
jgi:hypothetical protein